MFAKFDTENALIKAARKRVKDFDNIIMTGRQVDSLSTRWLQNIGPKLRHDLQTNGLAFSSVYREWMKDCKFFISLNLEELNALENQLESLTNKTLGGLNSLENEVLSLNSFLDEENIKIFEKWNLVHFNAFVRQEDLGIIPDTKAYDFKTGLPVLNEFLAYSKRKHGLSLPLDSVYEIPISRVTIIGEETDVGDSSEQILYSDPNNLIYPNRVFDYVVIRRETDSSGRRFNFQESYLTLLVEYTSLQTINFIQLESISQDTLLISELSYINTAGESVSIDYEVTIIDSKYVLMFSPVTSRYIKIKLENKAALAHTEIDEKITLAHQINNVFKGLGWDVRVNSNTESITGRLIDFSLSKLSTGLNIYKPVGYWQSNPLKIKDLNVLGFEHQSVQNLLVLSENNYLIEIEALASDPVVEFYCDIDIYDQAGNKVLEKMLPLPDKKSLQSEILVHGKYSKIKFIPDMYFTGTYNKIISSVVSGVPDLATIVTSFPHNLSPGDQIYILGSDHHMLVNEWTVDSVLNDSSFTLSLPTYDVDYGVIQSDRPALYVFVPGVPYFNVYKNNELLTLGVHYSISYDKENTWLTSIDPIAWYTVGDKYIAGDCSVQIFNPDYSAIYHIEYRPLDGQYLTEDKLARLYNNSILFDNRTQNTFAEVSVVSILRANAASPYTSPLVKNYTIKARSYGD